MGASEARLQSLGCMSVPKGRELYPCLWLPGKNMGALWEPPWGGGALPAASQLPGACSRAPEMKQWPQSLLAPPFAAPSSLI